MVDKLRSQVKFQQRLMWCIVIALMAVGAYSVENTNHQAYVACKRVQTLQKYAVQTIVRSEKTLPTLAYYKNPDHKAELKQQLALSEKAKMAFAPVTCHTNILGG